MGKLPFSYNQLASIQVALASAQSAAHAAVTHMEVARDIALRADPGSEDLNRGSYGRGLAFVALKVTNSLRLIESVRASLEEELAGSGDALAILAIATRRQEEREKEEEIYKRVRQTKRKPNSANGVAKRRKK